jgi:hypothetical protein
LSREPSIAWTRLFTAIQYLQYYKYRSVGILHGSWRNFDMQVKMKLGEEVEMLEWYQLQYWAWRISRG